MRIFFSAGEPSGDLHGSNLIRALREQRPDVECVGFGGERMAAAGCRLLYPLSGLAVMGVVRVLASAPTFLRLLSEARRAFREERPDAVVLIDYPGFNWQVARLAHAEGIPVCYAVPPQLWAWAGWRACKMRRWVDHVLCNLPFEPEWYRQRGIAAHYVGHPYFDELAAQRLDDEFLAAQRARPGTVIGLLPGSRNQEVQCNLPLLLGAARHIHAARPEARFLVACLHKHQQDSVQARLAGLGLPAQVCAGKTPEIISLSHSCVAVSGSVGLELLYHGKPSVVVYRVSHGIQLLCWLLKKAPHISLVNLLAGRELFPEFLTARDDSSAIGEHVVRWLNDRAAYKALCAELAALRERVAMPGACEQTARYLLDALAAGRPLAA